MSLTNRIGISHRESEIQSKLDGYLKLRFRYPWKELEIDLQREQMDSVFMIGYGSLLNPESAARTISDTPADGHLPVIAWGVKRLFDYDMPDSVIERYSVSVDPGKHRAALNTRWTGNTNEVCNGRAISLRVSDLDGLRERENHYDLMPVAWLPWEDLEASISLGFALCAPKDSIAVRTDILPFPPYLKVCREGAAMVSTEFEEFFFQTTYLADGATLLSAGG